MDDLSIKILNEDSVEVPISIWKLNLTYKLWSESITPWEHRRIFRILKIPYSIGNKYTEISDKRTNYNKISKTINEMKGLKKATMNLLFCKIIIDKRYDICDDIIYKILYSIHLNQ